MVELLTAVVIVVVAAGLIAVRLGSAGSGREVRGAAERFAQTARTVREVAVSRGQEWAVELDLAGGRYAVSRPGRAGEGWQAVKASYLKPGRFPAGVKVVRYLTPEGREEAGATQRIRFFPDGTSSGASLYVGTEETARGLMYRVVVHPHNGRVVCEEAKEEKTTEEFELGD